MASIIVGTLVGAAIAAATSTVSAIQNVRQAQTVANYQKAVAQAQADYTKSIVKVEADERARMAKFTFGAQRATAAAMGLGYTGTSVEEIQQMDIGLATLDYNQKLYEGTMAQWQADVTSQMADYNVSVAKYNAWSSVGLSTLTGAVLGGAGAAVGAAAAGVTNGGVATTASLATKIGAGIKSGYGAGQGALAGASSVLGLGGTRTVRAGLGG